MTSKTIIKITVFALFAASCAPKNSITLSPEALANDAGTTSAPLDTLAAYRKMPGSPKTVYVQGHWRKARHSNDSIYISGFYKSPKN